MTILRDILLGVMVLAVWLGNIGFARLASPLDRLHCTGFVNVAAGTGLLLAAIVDDGASVRCGKILLMLLFSLLSGAAISHALARMLALRGSAPEAAPFVARDREAAERAG